MPRRPTLRVERIQQRWQQSPFHGALLGIVSVAVATAAIGAVCALIALAVTFVY